MSYLSMYVVEYGMIVAFADYRIPVFTFVFKKNPRKLEKQCLQKVLYPLSYRPMFIKLSGSDRTRTYNHFLLMEYVCMLCA